MFYYYLSHTWQTLESVIFEVYKYIRENMYIWILIFIIIYTIRPLVFIPATPFNLFAGVVFWFFLGTVICTLANYFSAAFSYGVWHITGAKAFENLSGFKRINKIRKKLTRDTFFSVVLMRLFFFPFDLTNYLSGVFKIPFKPYLMATFAGIPGTAIFVLAGAAFYSEQLTSFSWLADNINYTYLYVAVIFFIVMLLISKYFQKKYRFS